MRLRILILCLLTTAAHGANWYVRPSFSGTHTGADWNTAWNDMGGIVWGGANGVNPGDTVWFAGGTYSSTLTFAANGATNSPITIRRVTASDPVPTSATGYSSAFNTAAILPPPMNFNKNSFVTFDGGVDDGVQITIGNSSLPHGVDWGYPDAAHGPQYSTRLLHTTVYGAQRNGVYGPAPGTAGYAIVASDYNGQTTIYNPYIGHCKMNGACQGLDVQDWNNGVMEYCQILNCIGAGPNDPSGNLAQHPDLVYFWAFNNIIFRYNIFSNSYADGIFAGGSGPMNNLQFYGNVCDQGPQGSGWCLHLQCGPNVPPTVINNTFINWSGNAIQDLGYYSVPQYGGPYLCISNNIFWNCNNALAGGTAIFGGLGRNSDYNLYTGNNSGQGFSGEAHSFNTAAAASSVFQSFSTGNYHLIGGSPAIDTGATLTQDGLINVDLDGNTRGASGRWDIGAYELGGAASTNPITQVSPGTLAFPGVLLTNTSATLQFNVVNGGAGALTGYVSGAVAPFSIVGSTNYALNAGQSATLTVKFTPTVSNTFSGTLSFTDNGGGSNSSIALSGRANVLLASPIAAMSGTLIGWFTSSPFIFQPVDVSGSNPNDPAAADAYYWFSVPTSTNYTITATVAATSSAGNSWWINIDNQPVDPAYVWDVWPVFPSGTTNALVSLRGNGTESTDQFPTNQWFLTAGPHQIILVGREANASVSSFTINGPSTGQPPAVTGPTGVTNDVFQGFQMSVSATGTPPLSFQWTSNSVALANQTNSIYNSFAPNANTNTYACIVTNLYGKVTNSAQGVLTNGTLPTFTLAPPSTYSNSTNGGISLSAYAIGTLPLFFHWKTNGVFITNAITTNYSLVPVVPAQTNTYILQVDNHYGTLNSSGTVVSITNGVTQAIITNQPQAVTNLRIIGFTLSVGADGTPPFTYQWQKNSNNISFFGSAMTISQCTTNDSGWYRCLVSNAFGGDISHNVFVSMTNGTLVALSGPTNWTAGTNVGIQFYSRLIQGDPPVFYQWSVLGTNIAGQVSTNLILPNVPAQTNTYTITANNFEGSISYAAVATITNLASGVAPQIVSQSPSVTAAVGVCAFTLVSAIGDAPLSYQWRKGGIAQPGFTNFIVDFCPANTSGNGNWDCVVSNSVGTVTSSVVAILFTNIVAPPIAISSSSADGKPFVYAQSPVNFSSAGSYSPSGLPLTYSWVFGDGTSSTLANPVHAFTGGFYNVRMSVSDGVNAPVFATDISLLVQPFTITGGSYYKKLMF